MASLQINNLLRHGGESRSIGEIVDAFAAWIDVRIAPRTAVAFIGEAPLQLIAAAAWLARNQGDGIVIPRERLTVELRQHLFGLGYTLVDLSDGSTQGEACAEKFRAGRVGVLTSGTTGRPKVVLHTWESLFTMRKVRELPEFRWLLTFREGTYAWYQMLTLALFVPGQSMVVPTTREPAEMALAAREGQVTAISAPPTFWRVLLLRVPREELAKLSLRQITLGGERVDQAILDALRQLYPNAMLTHIYASTEAGGCIVVHDGREGFPTAWLGGGDDGMVAGRPALAVRNGHLWIRSPFGSEQHRDWFDSGDAVEVRGDRVIILGRADRSIANVGGLKVPLCDVERTVLSHPSVLWCRARGVRAPLAGELVAAEIVSTHVATRLDEAELTRFCHERMPEHMVPRHWAFLEAIPATDNLKTRQN